MSLRDTVNVQLVRDRARSSLIQLLANISGKKALVLDPKIIGPLGLVAEYSLLKDHAVDNLYSLQPGNLDTECKFLVYICRPKMLYMKYIANHIHAHHRAGISKSYYIYLVPRRTKLCDRVLEEEGVLGEIKEFKEFELDLIPFEEDLLSMEMDMSFREVFLEGDNSSLYYVARSLWNLQSLYGIIPKIYGKGNHSKIVVDMLLRMRREMGLPENPVTPQIDNLIILDRTSDMLTPMCSQLTYEGLIDELYGIQNSYVDLDPSITGFKDRRKLPLTSQDPLYGDLRDKNFSVVGPLLNQSAKKIDAQYKERYQAKNISELRDFIGKLGGIQSEHQALKIHTNIAEQIMMQTRDVDFHRRLEVEQNLIGGLDHSTNLEYIEELIFRQEPIMKVLRLLCLYSIVNNGIKPKVLTQFKSEILRTYGYEHIFTLYNLTKLNLLKKSDSSRNPYTVVRKGLKLAVDNPNEKEPDDISYVYSGYAPILCRLIQYLLFPPKQQSTTNLKIAAPLASSLSAAPFAWKPTDEVMNSIPGATFEETQPLPPGLQAPLALGSTTQNKVTLVFFLGGVTFAEISAIRFLGDRFEGRDYIIGTTKLINGTTLLDTLVDHVDNRS